MIRLETLPPAGTPFVYRRPPGAWHKATIDSGMLMTPCGLHRWLPVALQARGHDTHIMGLNSIVDMLSDETSQRDPAFWDTEFAAAYVKNNPWMFCKRCFR